MIPAKLQNEKLNELSPEERLIFLHKKNKEGQLIKIVKELLADEGITTKSGFAVQCFKILEQDTFISKDLTELAGVLVGHVECVRGGDLVELAGWFIEAVKDNVIHSGRSLEVLVKLLETIRGTDTLREESEDFTGPEYHANLLNKLCTVKWRGKSVLHLSAMLREVPLAPAEVNSVITKICGSLKNVLSEDLPHHVYQLLLYSNKGYHKSVLVGIVAHFDHLDQQQDSVEEDESLFDTSHDERERLWQTEGTSLLHIMFAIKHDMELGKALLQHIKNLKRYTPFSLALGLSFVQHTRFAEQILSTLKSGVLRSLKNSNHYSNSGFVHGVLEPPVDIGTVLDNVISRSDRGWDYVTEGLVKLALILLEVPDTDDTSMSDIGVMILERCYKLHPHCKTSVLTSVLHSLITSTQMLSNKHQTLLNTISRRSLQLMLSQTNKLKDHLANVPLIPLKNAEGVLTALVPVMRYDTALRDYAILVFRKSLFSKDTNSRKIAVIGLMDMMRKFKMGEGYSQNSQLSCSQVQVHMLVTEDVNEAVCTEILMLLKRALSQQGGIRSEVYSRLDTVLTSNYKLYPMVLQLLQDQLAAVYEPDEGILPPLKLASCISVLPDTAVLREPLPHLLQAAFSCASLVRSHDPEAIETLDAILDSVTLRSTKADLEDWDVDRAAQFGGAGSRNLVTAETLSALLEVLMDDTIRRSNSTVLVSERMKKIFSVYHNLQEFQLIAEKQVPVNKGRKAKNVVPFFSLTSADKLLYSLITDDLSEHTEYCSNLKTISHLLTWVFGVISDHLKEAGGGEYRGYSSKEMCNILGSISHSLLGHLTPSSSLYKDTAASLLHKSVHIIFTFYRDKSEEYCTISGQGNGTTMTQQLYSLITRAVASDDYAESQHYLAILDTLHGSTERADLNTWLQTFLSNGGLNSAFTKDVISLLLSTSRQLHDKLTLHEELSRDLLAVLGDIDSDRDETAPKHEIVGEHTAPKIVVVLAMAIDKVLQDIEWCLHLGCSEDQAHMLCTQLVEVATILVHILQSKTPHGSPALDQISRTVKNFYNTFTTLVKHETAAVSTRGTLRILEKLSKLVGSNVNQKLYNFLIYMEQPYDNQKGKKGAAAIRKQAVTVPSIVYAVEQCERNLIIISKKSKTVDLMEHFKRSTARDFRIQTGILESKLTKQDAEKEESEENPKKKRKKSKKDEEK